MSKQQSAVAELISALKQQRDELKVRIHLGSEEAKQEWEKLEENLRQLMARHEPLKQAVDETADDVWESLKLVASEIKDGFQRIRKSL